MRLLGSDILPGMKGLNVLVEVDGELLKWLHHMTGNVKTFINGTYHGTSTKHLQMYLSEFCYRFNRRKLHGAIFDRLLVAVAG